MDKTTVETMIWTRDIPASFGWLLACRHLPIHKDIRKVILNLLHKRIEFFYPIQGVKWSNGQYLMYKSLYEGKRQILIHMNKPNGSTFGLAGIAMSFALQEKRVCVITNSIVINNSFVKILDKMGKPPVPIQMYCSSSSSDYDGSYNLTIIDSVDTMFRHNLTNIYKLVKEKNLLLLCTKSSVVPPYPEIFNSIVEIKNV